MAQAESSAVTGEEMELLNLLRSSHMSLGLVRQTLGFKEAAVRTTKTQDLGQVKVEATSANDIEQLCRLRGLRIEKSVVALLARNDSSLQQALNSTPLVSIKVDDVSSCYRTLPKLIGAASGLGLNICPPLAALALLLLMKEKGMTGTYTVVSKTLIDHNGWPYCLVAVGTEVKDRDGTTIEYRLGADYVGPTKELGRTANLVFCQ